MAADSTISSNAYRMRAGALLVLLLGDRIKRSTLAMLLLSLFIAVVIVLLIVGVAVDIRWLIVALMLLFIVVPSVAALLYISEALRPETVFNGIRHSLKIENGSLKIISEPEDEDAERRELLSVPLSGLKPYKVGVSSVSVPFGNSGGRIWIPASAFDTPDEFRKFIDSLYATSSSRNNVDPGV